MNHSEKAMTTKNQHLSDPNNNQNNYETLMNKIVQVSSIDYSLHQIVFNSKLIDRLKNSHK